MPHDLLATRWITVVGTGLLEGTPAADCQAAAAIGTELARHRYGLITGGWHGVDWVATRAFIDTLLADGLDPEAYVIQVLTRDQPLLIACGKVIRTPPGPTEWLEPQKWADAMVFIGGRGGTYYSWLGALHDGLPRLPLGGTAGDAAAAFQQTLDLWELMPVRGLTMAQFQTLGQPIDGPETAAKVARHLVGELLWRALDAVDGQANPSTPGAAAPLFLSYSRRNSDWVQRLRTLLRPLERRGQLATWVDADLEPGQPWEQQLTQQLTSARAALLLVSADFLASRYVREVEIPAFARRFRAGQTGEAAPFHLFWVLLSACDWASVDILRDIQALGGTAQPIDQLDQRSDQQCRLIEVVQGLAAALHPPA